MIFLSNSIEKSTNDIIGFDTYVNKLNEAIDSGAQMIAITSPFGSGKTSIVELLKKSRRERKNEKFLHIQMWSELNCINEEKKSNILHKNFLYQMGSAISSRKGTYINRRLSSNYGLLKLHVNNFLYWCLFALSVICTILAWILNKHSHIAIYFSSKLKGHTSILSSALFLIAMVLMVFIISRAEILFSSKKSEKQRVVEADEIIDLYRREILNQKGKIRSFFLKYLQEVKSVNWLPSVNEKTYIAIIEDLDRTNDGIAVIHFLKELRKYYLPMNDSEVIHQNKVIFIVNIKQESTVYEEAYGCQKEKKEKESNTTNDNQGQAQEQEEQEQVHIKNTADTLKSLNKESLYVKIFDYILNLQTINIVDYDIILCGLLEENRDYLEKHNLMSMSGKLSDIPGMQWIIKEKGLDIRQVKRRLNIATTIFETLKERFPEKEESISFEKCAVAAYLTTTYELEFSVTEDTAFEKLIEYHIQNQLVTETMKEKLGTKNNDYAQDVLNLIESNLIGNDYRMYFYNYPKNSIVYGAEETSVQNAILYGVTCRHLEYVAKRVVDSKSDVVQKSLKKIRQLKLPLPQTVLDTEMLFLSAVKYEYEAVLDMFRRMDNKAVSLDKNIFNIINILKYDSKRKVYTPENFSDFCSIWENVFDEEHLIKLREAILTFFKDEILFFEKLYFGEHNVISIKEMEALSLLDSVRLLNTESNNFSEAHIKYIVNRLGKEPEVTADVSEKVCKVLLLACEMFNSIDVVECFLDYMLIVTKIVPQLEQKIWELLKDKSSDMIEGEKGLEKQQEIFLKYQKLINSVAVDDLSDEILEHINELEEFERMYEYSLNVSTLLYQNGYHLMYLLIELYNGRTVDFSDENIIDCVKENVNWLRKNKNDFLNIRKNILARAENIQEFMICFSSEFPILSKEEFILLTNHKTIDITNVLGFFAKDTMNEEVVEYITEYFNKKYINNNIAYEVLKSIIKYDVEIVKMFFEKIDFAHSFLYATFSKEKKSSIKKVFNEQLELDTYKGKLKFMESTRFLDEKYETELLDHMDDTMIKKYVNLVQRRKGPCQINLTTIELLNSFSSYYAFSPQSGVNEKLLEEKEYEYYVISTTLYAKEFHMETGRTFEELWPTYIDIYSDQSRLSQTRAYMQSNKEFLRKIMHNEEYIGFPDNVLETLSVIPQSAALVSHIYKRGTSFAIKYFSFMKEGFVDREAAKKFVDLLGKESNKVVLTNNSVYDNVYAMLVDPGLKGRYTKLRKSIGCE